MTSSPNWKPSEEMIEATWIKGYLDMRTHPGTPEIIRAVRPLIIAEAKAEIEAGSPDDLRALGLTVAVHNDYKLNGEAHTFWLFTTPDTRAVKGEGRSDAEALNQVRQILREQKYETRPQIEAAERERIIKRLESTSLIDSISVANAIKIIKAEP